MPFSRHWIMHIEAINRIKSKLLTKGVKLTRFEARVQTFLHDLKVEVQKIALKQF